MKPNLFNTLLSFSILTIIVLFQNCSKESFQVKNTSIFGLKSSENQSSVNLPSENNSEVNSNENPETEQNSQNENINPAESIPLEINATATGKIYYVSTTGNNGNSGTSTSPFKTIQKAADIVKAGDTVIVRAGTYRERIIMKSSGTASQRITFQGEPGAIIDGGDVFLDWTSAPEVGAGVYKKRLPYVPQNMTWNDKYVLMIKDSLMSSSTGFTLLKRPSSDASWNGVEAFFGTKSGITYVRFRYGQNPNNEKLRFSNYTPGAIHIENKSFITVRGLTIMNAYNLILILKASNNNIIEKNTVLGGRESIFLKGYPNEPLANTPSRNHIRNNEISLNYIYTNYGNYYKRTQTDFNIWMAFKNLSSSDRVGIHVAHAGDDNQIYSNHIFKHHDGIDHTDYSSSAIHNRRLKIYNNNIHNMQDSGIEAIDSGIGIEWHDNSIRETTTSLRIKKITTGPLYIYRNRVSNVTQKEYSGGGAGLAFNASIDIEPNALGKVYFYHNSLVIGGTGLVFTTTPYAPSSKKLPNAWFINNIISSSALWRQENFGIPKSHFDYNWCGGSIVSGWPPALRNILSPGKTLWSDRSNTNFLLSSTSPAREKGIDLSKAWSLHGVSHPPLPGMTPGYFSGTKPDLGAVQYR